MGNSEQNLTKASSFVFPTTFAQRRLWFLEQLQPGGTSYLVPWALRLEGQLNAQALSEALNEIVRRNEVLRTTFAFKDGVPVQVVSESLRVRLPITDLSGSANSREKALELAREEARTRLDLERGPLVRAQLVRIHAQEHLLLLTLHHIIFDGWSRRIFVSELAALYEAFCAGEPSPLAPPKLQYADYSIWQHKAMQGKKLAQQLSYWKEQLAGVPATLDLPTDHPRPALQTFNGAKTPILIDRELTDRLNMFSREQGATLFMTLLAGFQVLLSRESLQDDIAVGTPIANRNRAEIEDMIGFFANTLVLRSRFRENLTFRALLAQVKESALGAYANQDLPFEKLVEELRPDRNLTQNPLFQTLFSLQNAPRQAFELTGLNVTFVDTGESSAKFDISVFLSETPEGIRGRFEYNTDLFEAATVQRMVARYESLLREILEFPDVAVTALPLTTAEEHSAILRDWNASPAASSITTTVDGMIQEQAVHTPDAIAVECRGNNAKDALTYRELNSKANQLARFLGKHGVRPGDTVAIHLEFSPELMVGLLAVQKAGSPYVFISPGREPEHIRRLLEASHAKFFLTRQTLLRGLPNLAVETFCVDSSAEVIANESAENLPATAQPDSLICFTFPVAGTGLQQGHALTHRGAIGRLTSLKKALEMGPGDVWNAPVSSALDVESATLFLALTVGGRVVFGEASSAGAELRTLEGSTRSVHSVPLKAVPRTGTLPFSLAQQRLWFLDKLQPNSALYNLALVLRMKGPFDIHAMRRAVNRIVARHDSLRTWFRIVGGTPMQMITPRLEIDLGLTSVMAVPERVRETEARRLIQAELKCPFDLATGPLVRVMLVKISDQDHVLALNAHQIVCDSWSVSVLRSELTELYRQEVSGDSKDLPALPVQYADYGAWQRQLLSGNLYKEQLHFWKHALQNAPPSLDLPTDRSRPAEQSFRGANFVFEIPASLTGRLKALAREEGAPLFTTLLAAFKTLLSRYCGQDDVLVGSPISGRSRVELENLVGCFSNTVVFRTQLNGDLNFRQLLASVRKTVIAAYAHKDIPFEKIVDELNPERDLSRSPSFQVMFALQDAIPPKRTTAGLEIDSMQPASTASKFDLTLTAAETGLGMRMEFEYATDLFDADRIERMQRHWISLLQAIAENPDMRIADLPMLDKTERQHVLVDWNATQILAPSTLLHEFVQKQAWRTPSATAIIDGTDRISYRELNSRANQLARKLQKLGVRPEVPVAVYMERCAGMMVALLAVLKAGGAYVPLDPMYPKERLAKILEDSHAPVMISQAALASALPPHSAELLLMDRDQPAIELEPETDLNVPVTIENLAYVLFTSGSTGRPKGVAIEHRSASIFVQWAQTVFTPEELSGTLFGTSICFDLSVFEMFVPLSVGGTVILAQNALTLPDLPAANEVRLINTVPSAIAELLRMNAVPSSVLTVNLAGEALPETLAREIYEQTSIRRLYNLYGPTEDTTYSTYTLVTRTGDVTIGRPIANTQAYILDAKRQPVPIGIPGELYLAGDGLARGYYGRDDLTAERFVPNPFLPNSRMYRTGDRCRYRPDGTIEYFGRIDNQVKLRGFRIELGEIESVLAQHPALQQSAVLVREDRPGDKRLVGYVVPKAGQKIGAGEIRDYLRQGLPDYMVPAVLVELASLPLNPNGKVDRKALPKPEMPGAAAGGAVPPRDAVEEKLLAIWQRVLQNPSMGITDNFFDMGGHSLMAAQLVSEIEKVFGRKMPLAALFRGATVEQMAHVLQEGTEAAADPIVMRIQAGRTAPFFAVVAPGMNSIGYAALAQAMGPQQTFYKLQSHRAVKPNAPITLEQMRGIARDYVQAMRTVQPHGPYYLGGMCAGTHIGEQMVLQLEAVGEKVALLAIFDTWVRQNSHVRWKWQVYYYRQRIRGLMQLSFRKQLRMIAAALSKKMHHIASLQKPAETSWAKLYWPGKDFQTPHFEAPVALFKRPKQPFYYIRDEAMGWGERSAGGVHIYRIDFPHQMLREPYVRELAKRLLECISRTGSAPVERLQVWPKVSENAPTAVDIEA